MDAQDGLVRIGEYDLPGLPEAAIISESIVRRPDFDGKDFGITVWMTLKIAQLAPIPGVSASTETKLNPVDFQSNRKCWS